MLWLPNLTSHSLRLESMESYNTAYAIDTAAVQEDCSVTVTDIFDVSGSVYGEFLDAGLNSSDKTGRSLLYST
jgi:hypothetical protein